MRAATAREELSQQAFGASPVTATQATTDAEREEYQPNCAIDATWMHGFNPRGQPFPAAPPHTFPTAQDCEFSGESLRVAHIHIGKTAGSTIHTLLGERAHTHECCPSRARRPRLRARAFTPLGHLAPARADANGIKFTEYEVAMADQLKRELDDYDVSSLRLERWYWMPPLPSL